MRKDQNHGAHGHLRTQNGKTLSVDKYGEIIDERQLDQYQHDEKKKLLKAQEIVSEDLSYMLEAAQQAGYDVETIEDLDNIYLFVREDPHFNAKSVSGGNSLNRTEHRKGGVKYMLFILVGGAPHSGKSRWIESFTQKYKNKNIKIIDIYHVQHQLILNTEQDVLNAYILMLQELKFTLQEHHTEYEIVIVEAPLLTQYERSLFLNIFIQNRHKEDHSLLVWCSTDKNTLHKRLSVHTTDNNYDTDTLLQNIESPTEQEDYDYILYNENHGIDNDVYIDLVRMHLNIDTNSAQTARECINKFESTEDTNIEYSRGLVYVIEDQS